LPKKIIIIGAGLAGLSTGIYLQKKGFETQIFELAPWSGGMCASWERNGYRFDGCIHWMVGTKKNDPIYELYKEVGALTDETCIFNAGSISVQAGGIMYEVPLAPDQFKNFLLRLSACDAQEIELFCSHIDMIGRTALVPGPVSGVTGFIKMLRHSRDFLRIVLKYRVKTVREVVNYFNSDIIRSILMRLMPGDYSALALFLMLGTRMGRNAGCGQTHGGEIQGSGREYKLQFEGKRDYCRRWQGGGHTFKRQGLSRRRRRRSLRRELYAQKNAPGHVQASAA
jgi:phytoene desaturase